MAQKNDCKDCDWYRREHYNYCKMCGKRVNPHADFAKIAGTPKPSEKYCGYCGKELEKCKC